LKEQPLNDEGRIDAMKRNTLGISCLAFAAVCGLIALGVDAEVGRQVVATGSAPSQAGWIAKLIPMLGSLGGIIAAIIAFVRSPSLTNLTPIIESIRPVVVNGDSTGPAEAVAPAGQHQAVLMAILSALQIASGKPAESKGLATLNGGSLEWHFIFKPIDLVDSIPTPAK
jgi:hypothetical protein